MKMEKSKKLDWKSALRPSIFKIILSIIPILMWVINITDGLSDRYIIFAILSIVIFSIPIWITSTLFAGAIKPIYIDMVWILILSIGIYIFISFLQKENKTWKKIITITIILIVYVALILISIASSRTKCPNIYDDTSKFSFNKSIKNQDEALLAFEQYTGLENIAINDIKYEKIKFTTNNVVLAWVLKTKRIAIDAEGKLYKHVVCF